MSQDREQPDRGPIERAVRASLESAGEPDPAARILRRIGGRTPRVVTRAIADRRLRGATTIAAAVLIGLLIAARDDRRPPSLAPRVLLSETQLSAVVVLDTAELDQRATADGLVSDLFDVELPE